MSKLFIAYPNQPLQIGQTIEQAINDYNQTNDNSALSWKAMNIFGQFISDEIVKQISQSVFVADVTVLNPNVIYEIGYAIGQKKFILIIRNSGIEDPGPGIQEVGIFDTLGYAEYQNSVELLNILKENKSNQPFKGETKLNLTAPVYVMNTQFKTDLSNRIISRINKAALYYRTFDPAELPRLSAHDAIIDVSESYGVVVQLLAKEAKYSAVHNLRAAFIAGLANGMQIPLKMIQHGFDPVPVDYRDIAKTIKKVEDIDDIIADLVGDVMDGIQNYSPSRKVTPSFLEKLDLGASAAENERRSLQNYYLQTDAFYKAVRGEVQLVIGRKGTGKTAIFYQIINKEKASSKNLVIDLQPDGYKLLKFKDQILEHLEEGTFQHTIMAFWEYLLLLEVANKILVNDKNRYLASDTLRGPYQKLEEAYHAEKEMNSGDFSDRMLRLVKRMTDKFEKMPVGEKLKLSDPEVTGLVHESDIKELKTSLSEYLRNKDRVWILFDNIDKGWPASGLTDEDVLIIRALLDASRNLQRYFERSKVNLFPLVFLRSDVYYRLVLGTSDRQKEAKVLLDWIDQDLLARLIELRIMSNDEVEQAEDFKKLWRDIAVSHYKGEDSFQFIIDRSLMRPRFLINFINHCKSFAVNLNHEKITENDILKGFAAFSADVLTDVGLEIRDIYPDKGDILSSFYLTKSRLSPVELDELLRTQIQDTAVIENVIEILLWYGFLGVHISNEETSFIYNVNYNIDLLKTIIKKKDDSLLYVINPAFWPSLHVTH